MNVLKVGAKTKRDLHQIIPFGLIWLLSGWVFILVELAVSGSSLELPDTAIRMDIQIFLLSSVAITVVGLLTGFIELKYLHEAFLHKNFAIRSLYKFFIYSLFFFLIVLVTFPIAASLELDASIFDSRVWEKYGNYITSITHLSTAVQLGTALILSLFYTEISEFIGQDVLMNFFIGKYHNPIEEERIFMFLDMKSSTTIAEQLGHLAYFKLLRDYYHCFTDAIIENEGEVYGYVGDEIILSWKFEGDKRDHRCIDCFFAMRGSLEGKEGFFNDKFGQIPTFKAGIHYGKVTTGEIGTIKKDILFSGDVLNAAARIQGLCNSYETDLIVSAEMLDQLDLKPCFCSKLLGAIELRGKEESKELFAISRAF